MLHFVDLIQIALSAPHLLALDRHIIGNTFAATLTHTDENRNTTNIKYEKSFTDISNIKNYITGNDEATSVGQRLRPTPNGPSKHLRMRTQTFHMFPWKKSIKAKAYK